MSGPPTPGVFIQAENAFPNSVVPVKTNVVAFLGYTQKAKKGDKDLTHIPTLISSFSEFIEWFGGPPSVTYNISDSNDDPGFVLTMSSAPHIFYFAIKHFYQNKGDKCYIISVGDYDQSMNEDDFLGDISDSSPRGLMALEKETEPAILAIPEAILFSLEACSKIQIAMLRHCAENSRFAILDIHDGHLDLSEKDVIENFRNGIGIDNLKDGAVYYPWLNTNAISSQDITFKNIDPASIQDLITILKKSTTDTVFHTEIEKLTQDDVDKTTLHKTLVATLPLYKTIVHSIAKKINLLPPSGAMAGIYTFVDSHRSVHQPPANVSLISVSSPSVNINDQQQGDLNVPIDGKAVNAIRSFVGKGILVWGARTLDGNSLDWRFITVRRTMIVIEQSIKLAMNAFTFKPNDANTWAIVKNMINNFLTNLWHQGALTGTSPTEAFSVEIGLGTTMTSNDILEGLMICSVSVAMVRPAEFIAFTIRQEMISV